MLTNVAIVVMRLVGLAPASVEQRNTCRHASRVRSLAALGDAYQRLDRRRGVRASDAASKREALKMLDIMLQFRGSTATYARENKTR